MKKFLPFLFLLFFPSLGFGANIASLDGVADSAIASINGIAGTAINTMEGQTYNDGDTAGCTDANPAGTCTGFVSCFNAETTAEPCSPTCAEDNSETWTKTLGTNGTITVDNTTSPLRGSQDVAIYGGDSGQRSSLTSPTYSGVAAGTYFFRYSTSDATPGSSTELFRAADGTDTTTLSVYSRTDGNLRVYAGASSCTTDLANYADAGNQVLQDNTKYYTWVDYSVTGGTVALYVSTARTKPASAACSASSITYSSVSPVSHRYSQVGSITAHYDQGLLDDATIGTVCE